MRAGSLACVGDRAGRGGWASSVEARNTCAARLAPRVDASTVGGRSRRARVECVGAASGNGVDTFPLARQARPAFFFENTRVCGDSRDGEEVCTSARRLHRTARARPELERHELLRTPDLALRRGVSPLRRLVRPASPVQERRERGACARSAHRPTSGPWFVVQPLTRPSPDPPPQDDERYEKYLDSAVEVLKVVAMIGAAYFVYRAMDR